MEDAGAVWIVGAPSESEEVRRSRPGAEEPFRRVVEDTRKGVTIHVSPQQAPPSADDSTLGQRLPDGGLDERVAGEADVDALGERERHEAVQGRPEHVRRDVGRGLGAERARGRRRPRWRRAKTLDVAPRAAVLLGRVARHALRVQLEQDLVDLGVVQPEADVGAAERAERSTGSAVTAAVSAS